MIVLQNFLNKKQILFSLCLSFSALLTSVFFLSDAVAQTSQNRVALKGDWAVFYEASPLECWSTASPETSVVKKNGEIIFAKRSNITLLTTFRPSQKVSGQTSFSGGYPFKKGSTVEVIVDGGRFEFGSSGEWAWPKSVAEDAKVINAFQKGGYVTIKGESSRGAITEDTFSLRGYFAATKDAATRCGEQLKNFSATPTPQYQHMTSGYLEGPEMDIIYIQGEIEKGDIEKFNNQNVDWKKTIVLLNSVGGSIVDAMTISSLIKMKGVSTWVLPDHKCISECALIWLAGKNKILSTFSQIGFEDNFFLLNLEEIELLAPQILGEVPLQDDITGLGLIAVGSLLQQGLGFNFDFVQEFLSPKNVGMRYFQKGDFEKYNTNVQYEDDMEGALRRYLSENKIVN